MAGKKQKASLYAVIGDLVGSRRSTDRRDLHRRLSDALAGLAGNALQPLAVTAGDEFQGTFATLGQALGACWSVQLALLPQAQARFGLGHGTVTVLDAERGTQDGPAWWRARDAIEWVALAQDQAATRQLRTAYRADDTDPPGHQDAVNAALHCRDHMVHSLDERSMRILRGMVDGLSQAELARREGISPSAVSQRVRRDGLGVLVSVEGLLGAQP